MREEDGAPFDEAQRNTRAAGAAGVPFEVTVCSLHDQRDPERHIPAVLPWVYEATWPPFDRLIGDTATGHRLLARCMARESSEASIRRATLLLEDGRPTGGFIALTGRELPACRRSDTFALIGAVGPDRRAELARQMRALAKLYMPVAADEYYLSRLGVQAEGRGAGRGRRLVHEFLESGLRAGYQRFRLDVAGDNLSALALYGSVGFRVAAMRQEGPSALIAMAWETSSP